jgi:hypothetical protein
MMDDPMKVRTLEAVFASRWPVVSSDDWCGEFETGDDRS